MYTVNWILKLNRILCYGGRLLENSVGREILGNEGSGSSR